MPATDAVRPRVDPPSYRDRMAGWSEVPGTRYQVFWNQKKSSGKRYVESFQTVASYPSNWSDQAVHLRASLAGDTMPYISRWDPRPPQATGTLVPPFPRRHGTCQHTDTNDINVISWAKGLHNSGYVHRKKREARDGRDVLTCLDGLGFQGQSSYHLRFEWTMKAKLSTSRMPHLIIWL